MMPTLGSLFAGIGGIDLGFERAGFKTSWQVEIQPYCRKVLARHFPDAERFNDVRTVGKHNLKSVDVIAGGFPCQDISNAGKRAGIGGGRSGLWSEQFRIVRELRPRFLLVENVAALLDRGIATVLGNLASIGFDAEWEVLGVDTLGASQHRERLWLLAYPNDSGLQGPIWAGKPHPPRQEWKTAYCEPLRSDCGIWPPGPRAISDIPRMADGPADRMDRLKGLGNSVVPMIPELIARAIYGHLTAVSA